MASTRWYTSWAIPSFRVREEVIKLWYKLLARRWENQKTETDRVALFIRRLWFSCWTSLTKQEISVTSDFLSVTSEVLKAVRIMITVFSAVSTFTLKIGASSSELVVLIYQTTQRHMPQDRSFQYVATLCSFEAEESVPQSLNRLRRLKVFDQGNHRNT
jgi:hypothetical protein